MRGFQLKGTLVKRNSDAVVEIAAILLMLIAFWGLGTRISFAGPPQEQDLTTLQLVAFEPPIKAPDFVLRISLEKGFASRNTGESL